MGASRLASVLLAAALGVAAVLGAIEIGARLWPLPDADLRGLHVLRPDRPWLFGLRPGGHHPIAGLEAEYVINSAGLRGPEIARPKPADVFRVALLGDSLTFGWGVREEDTLGRRLQERLQAGSGARRIEVVNLGVSGYNPYTEEKWLAEIGPVVEPDLVVVQFCVNDLNDPTAHFDYATRTPLDLPDEAFPDPTQRRPPAPLAERLCARSRACSLLRARFPTAEDRRRGLAAVAPHGDPTAQELAWLGARYGAIAATAERLGARFALLVFPYATQLEPGAPTTLQDDLRALAEERGWLLVDLLPAYRRAHAERPGERFFVDLWHPTAAGFEIAGAALATRLACAGLAPAPAPDGACDERGAGGVEARPSNG